MTLRIGPQGPVIQLEGEMIHAFIDAHRIDEEQGVAFERVLRSDDGD
jgi:hypothetical protein